MQYLVNATFLINSAKADFSFIENLELSTLQSILDEVTLQIGLDIEIIIDIEIVCRRNKKTDISIPKNKLKLLSPVDRKLLEVAFERKKNILLISDDRQIRNVSKHNRIRCTNTPQFVAHLVKQSKVDRNDALYFLKKLRSIYIRSKDMDTVIRRLEKWM